MTDNINIFEFPSTQDNLLIAGWRQWADGGALSSGLPAYLSKLTGARKIAEIDPDDYYLFQLPVTQDLMRPIVRHNQGYTESLQSRRNEFFYSQTDQQGLIFFIGDEPHLRVESYVQNVLAAALKLNVKRIIILGGIYAEMPFDKDRFITAIYSLPELKPEVVKLGVNLSDYHGGASIGSYLCKRAGDIKMELFGLYSFSPIIHIPGMESRGETIHIVEDYKAWVNIMRHVNQLLKIQLDLSDLETKSEELLQSLDDKIAELDKKYPDLEIQEYIRRVADQYSEPPFNGLEDVWEEELRRLGDQFDLDGDD